MMKRTFRHHPRERMTTNAILKSRSPAKISALYLAGIRVQFERSVV